jgi:excisionase family DNA binding protein
MSYQLNQTPVSRSENVSSLLMQAATLLQQAAMISQAEQSKPVPAPVEDEIFNVKQAAEYLKISESSVRTLLRENSIPFYKVLNRYQFSKSALIEWRADKGRG